MPYSKFKLTVLFEDPFWIALCEREYKGKYEICKITFGAEPRDNEVYKFMLKNWHKLKFSLPIETETIVTRQINPKRMQRIIKKQIDNTGIGTKAQQVLKLQQEQNKLARKSINKAKREEEKQRKYKLKEMKHKEKHKGH